MSRQENAHQISASLNSHQDIGIIAHLVPASPDIAGRSPNFQKQLIPHEMKQSIGQRQVSVVDLEHSPQWLLDDALCNEMDTNWRDAYTEVPALTTEEISNVISSHVVYKIKESDNDTLKLKASLVLHGILDKDRFAVHRDSASADLLIVRMDLSFALILDFSTVMADVKGSYMQSRPIKRKLFLHPPKQLAKQDVIWKLLRLP